MLDTIKSIIKKVAPETDVEKLTLGTRLADDLGFDSLSMMLMSMEIEEEFGFRFEDVVREAIDAYEPSIVTRYILDVAGAYNRFYHNCSILGAENEQVKNTRIALTRAANTVLGNAFGLICLAKTEKI